MATTASSAEPVLQAVPVEDFEASFPALHRAGYQAAYRLVGQRFDAEELAQEAVAGAYVRWAKVAGHAVPWVMRVATNRVIDEVRRSRRHSGELLDVATSDPQLERRRDLVAALARLSRRQREVVALR